MSGHKIIIPGMTLRQCYNFSCLFDGKSSGPVAPLQILETIDRDSTRSRRKLQQSRLLLSVPRSNDFPEILDNLVLLLVATIVGMLLPVVHIDVRDTADQEFELPFIKDIDKIGRNQFIKPCNKGVELLLNPLLNLPLSDQSVSLLA